MLLCVAEADRRILVAPTWARRLLDSSPLTAVARSLAPVGAKTGAVVDADGGGVRVGEGVMLAAS